MPSDRDTIFALSSGRPPAAVAVVRISGPRAGFALEKLVGRVPAAARRSRPRAVPEITRTAGSARVARLGDEVRQVSSQRRVLGQAELWVTREYGRGG